MISKQVIAITEKQVLHYFIDHLSERVYSVDFVSSLANDFKAILIDLFMSGLSPIKEHIVKKAPSSISIDIIDAIMETKYQEEKIDNYLSDLKTYYSLEKIETTIIQDIGKEISKKGEKDIEQIKLLHEELGKALEGIEKPESEEKEYITFSEMTEEHKSVIEDRSKDIKQTTGCANFDKIMPNIYPGISIIAGYSGSAKSTLTHYLIKQRLIRRLPTCFINTELAKASYMDAMLSPLANVNYTDMLGLDIYNESIDYQEILDKIDTVQTRFSKNTNFLYFNKYNCSVKEIEKFIIYSRKSMKLAEKTVLFLFVDLLSMVSDFNKSHSGYNNADSITLVLNIINDICLSTNTHLFGTIQLKRIADVPQIKQMEDIEKFRPTASEIKASGGWEERARAIYLIHNPWNIVHKNPCSEVLKAIIEPIIDVTLVKDTYLGHSGESIQYLFMSQHKTFIPFTDNKS